MAKYNRLDTSQSQSKPMQGPSGSRCTDHVPRSLYGPVGMPPRCTLVDGPHGEPHQGDHRATFSIMKVGKVLFKWKTQPTDGFLPG